MIYSDNTFDITNNIATYTRRDFKSVFDTTSNKWYILDNGSYIESVEQGPAPTISTLFASTIYRNSAHLTTLMRNGAEQVIWSYMKDDILKKGEAPLQIDYLCFEANTAGSTIALSNTNISPNIEYSRDKNTWTTWDYSALSLQNVGDKIYMRGSNPNGIGLTETNVSKFIMTGSISVSGNIMTLIDKVGETLIIPSNYCFRNLFRQCTSLVEANISLPATTLTNYCYDNIFRDCTNLSKAPVLVATNANYTGCYRSLFNGCNALNKIITYAQTIGANSTELWVDKVAATGDFYNLGGATYQSGASGIPSGWAVHTSL